MKHSRILFLLLCFVAFGCQTKETSKDATNNMFCYDDLKTRGDTCLFVNQDTAKTNRVYYSIDKLQCCVSQIRSLSLNADFLSNKSLKGIGRFRNLRTLHVANFKEIPEELARLPNLEYLDIVRNPDAATKLPDNLGKMKSLKHLGLAGFSVFPCQVLAIPHLKALKITLYRNTQMSLPKALSKQTSIEYVNLEHFHEFPKVLLDMPQLKKLYIEEGTATIPPQIDQLQQLECLRFTSGKNNKIPWQLGSLPQLKELTLSATKEFPPSLAHLKKLRYLWVARTREKPGKNLHEVLAGLAGLEELFLTDYDFAGLDPKIPLALKNLPKLYALYCTGDFETLPSELFNLTQLTELDIKKHQYKNEPKGKLKVFPKGLSKLRKLTRLNLVNLGLTQFPEEILTLKKLTFLELRGSPIPHLDSLRNLLHK